MTNAEFTELINVKIAGLLGLPETAPVLAACRGLLIFPDGKTIVHKLVEAAVSLDPTEAVDLVETTLDEIKKGLVSVIRSCVQGSRSLLPGPGLASSAGPGLASGAASGAASAGASGSGGRRTSPISGVHAMTGYSQAIGGRTVIKSWADMDDDIRESWNSVAKKIMSLGLRCADVTRTQRWPEMLDGTSLVTDMENLEKELRGAVDAAMEETLRA